MLRSQCSKLRFFWVIFKQCDQLLLEFRSLKALKLRKSYSVTRCHHSTSRYETLNNGCIYSSNNSLFFSGVFPDATLSMTTTSISELKKNESSSKNNAETGIKSQQFAQVSQDMSELVYHLNSIQNDISELAGRPISLTKIED